jgi:hypothetical protein
MARVLRMGYSIITEKRIKTRALTVLNTALST